LNTFGRSRWSSYVSNGIISYSRLFLFILINLKICSPQLLVKHYLPTNKIAPKYSPKSNHPHMYLCNILCTCVMWKKLSTNTSIKINIFDFFRPNSAKPGANVMITIIGEKIGVWTPMLWSNLLIKAPIGGKNIIFGENM
jgi:hypothetical protein